MQLSKVILSDREELALDIADLAGRVWSTLQRYIRCVIKCILGLDQKLLCQILPLLAILIRSYEFNGVGIQFQYKFF